MRCLILLQCCVCLLKINKIQIRFEKILLQNHVFLLLTYLCFQTFVLSCICIIMYVFCRCWAQFESKQIFRCHFLQKKRYLCFLVFCFCFFVDLVCLCCVCYQRYYDNNHPAFFHPCHLFVIVVLFLLVFTVSKNITDPSKLYRVVSDCICTRD